MKLTETRIDGKTIFDGKIIKVIHDKVKLENGETVYREVVRHPGGVCVAAFDNQKNLYFVRQLRYPYGQVVLELPAGKLEPDRSESALEGGKRELTEETGMAASKYYDLGTLYPTPGYCDEIIYMYAAGGLIQKKQRLDEDEFLEVEKIPLDKAVEMVLSGEIKDAKTQVCLLKLKTLIDKNELDRYEIK